MSRDYCRAGAGQLGIELVAGQSTATSLWSASPLRILVPRPRGPSVWACQSSLGGGLVAGDVISMTVDLGKGTRCYLGTQASTKVYRNEHCRPCEHHLRARLGGGSLLVLSPDPVQAFEHSRYIQKQVFWLAQGSGLVLVDWLCCGRAACGERWAFDRFQSRLEVFVDGSRAMMDSLLLDAADGPLADPQRMGRFNCLALVMLIGEPLQAASAGLQEEFARSPVRRQAPLVSSASPIAQGGVFIRLAGENVEAVGTEIRRLLAFVPQLLEDCPWSRKW